VLVLLVGASGPVSWCWWSC